MRKSCFITNVKIDSEISRRNNENQYRKRRKKKNFILLKYEIDYNYEIIIRNYTE